VIEGRDLQERSQPCELQEHEDEGHSLPGRWVNSHELHAVDWIITRSGTRAIITEIRQHFEPAFPVSNLTIFGHHNYSVGDVGVLVHNVSVCDGTIADLRKLRADGMSEGEIKDWLRRQTDKDGNSIYNDKDIVDAMGIILHPNGGVEPGQVASAYPRGRRVGGRGQSVRPSDPTSGFQEADAWDLTPENQRLMEAGRSPIGRDGREVVLHHRDQSRHGPLDEKTATTHDNVSHPKSPSEIDRNKFARERARYWRTRIRILLGQA
jgi:hypothetical protein